MRRKWWLEAEVWAWVFLVGTLALVALTAWTIDTLPRRRVNGDRRK